MENDLLTPLQSVIQASEALMTTSLSRSQDQVNRTIHRVAADLFRKLKAIPDVHQDTRLLSFETRSHLATMTGYAEMLLDDAPGALTPEQVRLLQTIRSGSNRILAQKILIANAPAETG